MVRKNPEPVEFTLAALVAPGWKLPTFSFGRVADLQPKLASGSTVSAKGAGPLSAPESNRLSSAEVTFPFLHKPKMTVDHFHPPACTMSA
jgi:hypothetical protein